MVVVVFSVNSLPLSLSSIHTYFITLIIILVIQRSQNRLTFACTGVGVGVVWRYRSRLSSLIVDILVRRG